MPVRHRYLDVCLGLFVVAVGSSPRVSSAQRVTPDSSCMVVRIIDGDTLECEQKVKVRLIGIDAPERGQRPFGADASKALHAMLPVGSLARLEYDATLTDRYKRTLAYVWRGDTLVNEQMVASGWAVAVDYPPNVRHSARLHAADREARAQRKGMWTDGTATCLPPDYRRKRC